MTTTIDTGFILLSGATVLNYGRGIASNGDVVTFAYPYLLSIASLVVTPEVASNTAVTFVPLSGSIGLLGFTVSTTSADPVTFSFMALGM